jgi:hypothetical protein
MTSPWPRFATALHEMKYRRFKTTNRDYAVRLVRQCEWMFENGFFIRSDLETETSVQVEHVRKLRKLDQKLYGTDLTPPLALS